MDKLDILTFAPFGFQSNPGIYGGGNVFLWNLIKNSDHTSLRWQIINFRLRKPLTKASNLIILLASLLRCLIESVMTARKKGIEVIFSATEMPHSVLLACLTSRVTNLPWVALIHAVPCYGQLSMEYNRGYELSDRFRDIFCYVGRSRKYNFVRTFVTSVSLYFAMKLLRDAYVITINPWLNQRIAELKLSSSIIGSLRIGVDMKEIERARRIDGPKTFEAIFVSRKLHMQKGLFDCLQIWRIVTSKLQDAKLVLVGQVDNRTLERIEYVVGKYHIRSNVILLSDSGHGVTHEKVLQAMKQSNILLYPTRKDVSPTVVAEALAMGLPVITYDIPSVKHAYGAFPSVVFTEKGNVERAADAVLNLLTNNRVLNELSSEASKNRFKLDVSQVAESLEMALVQVAQGNPPNYEKFPIYG